MEIGSTIEGTLAAYVTFFIAIVSPGPANVLIASFAMQTGRIAALGTALGVIVGSAFWGIVTSAGLATLLVARPDFLFVIKIAGGGYLLWLAYKVWKGLLAPRVADTDKPRIASSLGNQFLIGLAIHLTNPKAPLAWIGIIALALGGNVSPFVSFIVVAGTTLIATIVYGGIALLFSTTTVVSQYNRISRFIDVFALLVFSLAGFALLYGTLGIVALESLW